MLLRGARGQGLRTLTAEEVVVDADVPEIPVGIDGETVMMPTPVRCTIQPRALRVRVPRDRPGTRPVKPALDWSALRHLASFRSTPALDGELRPGPSPGSARVEPGVKLKLRLLAPIPLNPAVQPDSQLGIARGRDCS
jgi:hypothetical protein